MAQRRDDDRVAGRLRAGGAARGEEGNSEKTGPAFHVREIV